MEKNIVGLYPEEIFDRFVLLIVIKFKMQILRSLSI